ncbi:hypothetical protein JVX96_00620 [Variovorax sp. PDNC026]|uniref:hypothetical protein n=1 Tax=Variovorax sp. PDNC026 TaxID=2811425 RepID=UPI0019628921|nr:hypothetical protein [Variovorax sp. PDNC026]QRY31866.1 hypothetical protein JVX96_00620 [Variovorax sp. PDNC026]
MLQRSLHLAGFVATCVLACAELAACSSDDSRIYDAYKCGNVAHILGRHEKAAAAILKAKPFLEKKTGNPSHYMMGLRTKLTDDMALYKLSPRGQAEKINDIYESGTCQTLYQ